MNSKIREQAQEIFNKIPDIFLFYLLQVAAKRSLKSLQKDTVNAVSVQQKLLRNILKLQKDTKYGKKYNFAAIDSVAEFQRIHPLTTYEDYREVIEDIAKSGNFSQLVAEPIILFQETSGTTGKSKLIPRTKRLLSTSQKSFQAINAIARSYYLNGKAYAKNSRGLALASTQPLISTPSGIPRGSGSSGGIRQSKSFQKIVSLNFSSPTSIFLIPDYRSAYYCHMLFALLEPKLTYITANFASNVLDALQILEREWSQMVNDIYHGQINSNLELDTATRNELQNRLRPSPEKSNTFRTEFEKGFEGIIPRIWPQLSNIQCIITGSLQLYKESLKFYAGEIPIYSHGYGASEAWIGCNLEPQKDFPAYVITPHSAFFEFIPISQIDAEKPTTVDLTSLDVGESYEIVVTTVAGLYRYRMGDIVKCVGYYNQSPMIEFLYRQGSLLIIRGVRISENEIFAAITEASEILGEDCKIIDYTTSIDVSSFPVKYNIYLEVSKIFTTLPDLTSFRDKFEQVIYDLNVLYLNTRKANIIGAPEIKLLKRDSFKMLKNQIISQGTSEAQFKMPRLLKNVEQVNFIESKSLN
ncbi:MAG: GH3 auxin-responsive promoter family protein [Nostoc sp.]